MRRRAFTIGTITAGSMAVVLAVAAVSRSDEGWSAISGDAPPRNPTSVVPVDAGVTWDSELAFQTCCSDSVIRSDFSRTGGDEAFQSLLRYGDEMIADGTRAEVHTSRWPESRFTSGDTVYYGFSVYVVSDWETDSSEEIVFQWHTEPDDCEDAKYPSAFLSIQPEGMWRLRVNSDDTACTTAETMTRDGFDLGAVEPGSWHDFVFKYEWDYTDEGSIEVWQQTDKHPGWESVLVTSGPNTFNDDEGVAGYLKWGLYKPAWNSAPTDVVSRVLFHDNIAFGGSFEAVDPSIAR